MNVLTSPANIENAAELFRLMAQPARLQILILIGQDEACVCHLEAALGLRQAYISQQLMALRDAGLVTTTRDGRNVYYQLANPGILDIITQAGEALAVDRPLIGPALAGPITGCPCPRCAELTGIDPIQAALIACDSDEPSACC